MPIKKIVPTFILFKFPLSIATSIALHLILQHGFHLLFLANLATWIGITIGSIQLLKKTLSAIKEKKMALDYIAILAILVALIGHYYLVGAVIMLMLSGGYALEAYGLATATRSLTALIDRIPNEAQIWKDRHITETKLLSQIHIGENILIRKGEIIPMDGRLISEFAETDESSITGEPYFLEKHKNDSLRSGTVNIGDPIVMEVTALDQESSYRNIIKVVQQAQLEKSPMIRMADQYSLVFLGLTFLIVCLGYWLSHDSSRILAILVVATPCPLILATPIALMGGVSAASKRLIIVKHLASLEALSRVQALIFDKTGTITLGKPTIKKITCLTDPEKTHELLGIAAAIERNSLHPLAKAIVQHAKTEKAPLIRIENVSEKIGYGISGAVDHHVYLLSKITDSDGMSIGLFDQNQQLLLQFEFEDSLKKDAQHILEKLSKTGLHLYLYTGDKKERTKVLLEGLGLPITVATDCTPEQKKEKITELKRQGKVTAMIGDGINDAPALAAADVGLVFSHEEQTASTDAADIVFLGGDLSLVFEAIQLSKETIRIARHGIVFGIGASVIAMIAAALGYVPPISGALLQEGIDAAVILYALRSSRIQSKI